MEKLVINQLEGEIQIPEELDFACSDESLLRDQLKILQMLFRKERNKEASVIKVLNSRVDNVSSKVISEDKSTSKTLKDKVEKHKQIMVQRREDKLKVMDEEAEALFKSSNEKKSSDVDQNKVSKMKEELDNFNVKEKRDSSDFASDERKQKRSKLSHNEKVKDCTRGANKSSEHAECSSFSKGTSLIHSYESCNTAKSRKEVRDRAIQMMKKQGFQVSVVEPGNFSLKYALSAPYHLFFTRVEKSKQTYDQPTSITFPEILDISLGEIEKSLHINFMVDVGWLCLQYLLAGQRTDMFILFGDRVDKEKLSSNITMVPIFMPTKFGCHHTKVMILMYKDNGIRVVVSTANLYSDDWDNRTQGSVK